MAAFGSATPISKLVGQSFPIWIASSVRMVFALALLLPIILVSHRNDFGSVLSDLRGLSTSDRVLLAGMGLIGTFGFTVLMLLGMRRAPGVVAAVVMAATPAITAIGAVAFLGEGITWERVTAVALAGAGVVVINVVTISSSSGGDEPVVGSLLIFGAVGCEAAYSLMGKRLTTRLDPPVITSIAAVGALVALVPLAAFGPSQSNLSTSAADWLLLLWWGAGTLALGSILWFQGMRRVPATVAAGFMAVMPVSALVLSYLLLDEVFHWPQLVGMGVVLAGLALLVRAEALAR